MTAKQDVAEAVLRDTYLKLRYATTEEKLFKARQNISENIEGYMPEWTDRIKGHSQIRTGGLQKFRCDTCKAQFATPDNPDIHQESECGCSEGAYYRMVLEEEI